MNQTVSFSARLLPKIDDSGTINAFVDKLIALQERDNRASIYEIHRAPNEYFIYARFATLALFKQNLEVGFQSIAGEMLDTFSIVDARFFGEIDAETKSSLDEFGMLYYRPLRSISSAHITN